MLRGLLEINPHKRLNYEQILKHPWLEDYDESLQLFNDQEREMIKKEYTYNDASRYNRNENEDPVDCFTEHNIDSVYNTLKNCSEKSIILAPFNSTQSEDIETFKSNIKPMMVDKQLVLRLSRLCREIDR
jgi:serine/threonine protein kinase